MKLYEAITRVVMGPQWHRTGAGRGCRCDHCDTVYTRITLNWRRDGPGGGVSLGRCHGGLGPLCPFVSWGPPVLLSAPRPPLPHWIRLAWPAITRPCLPLPRLRPGAVGLAQPLLARLALATVLTLHRGGLSRGGGDLGRLLLLSSGCGWVRLGGGRHSTGFFFSFP